MKPERLSASGVQVYELCPARFKAEYIDRTPRIDGAAGSKGTACHEAMEFYVAGGHHNKPDLKVLLAFYDTAYWKLFSDTSEYDAGVELLTRWYNRSDTLLDGRKILSTEAKETFRLVSKTGAEIDVTYIWDRGDEREDGSIEVVDYKTVALPVQPEDLKKRIQPRLYALSAAIKYPNRPAYWVTFDLLKYEPVGAKFLRNDNVETYRYLQGVLDRILDDDGTTEKLNPECRWCVRKTSCQTLIKHIAGGGVLRITDINDAVDRRAQMDYAVGALKSAIGELDDFILGWCEENGEGEVTTDTTTMVVTTQARREVDNERALHILGPDVVAKYGKLPMTVIDGMLKDKEVSDETKAALKALIRKRMTSPSVKTKPVSPVDVE